MNPTAGLPLFDAPPRESEYAKGRRIVSEIASLPDRAAYLEMVRVRMRELYFSACMIDGEFSASVTPDMARRYFESLNPPADMSRNFLAAVWKEPGWKMVGTYISETPRGHGNKLNAYAWTGE